MAVKESDTEIAEMTGHGYLAAVTLVRFLYFSGRVDSWGNEKPRISNGWCVHAYHVYNALSGSSSPILSYPVLPLGISKETNYLY